MLIIICLTSLIINAQESTQKRTLVNQLIDKDKSDSAIIILKQILNDSPKDSIEHQGRVLHQIGKILSFNGQPKEAFQYLEQAKKKYRIAQNQYLETRILQSYGQVYADLGNLDSAIIVIQQALNYWKKNRDTTRIMGSLLDLGLYYYDNNNPTKALDCYIELVSLPYRQDLIQKAKAYNQMGNIWSTELGNEKKALEYYLKSLEIKLGLEGDYKNSITASYNNIGLSYKILNKLDSAAYYYQKAIQTGKSARAWSRLIEPLNNLANIYKRQNNFAKAEQTLLEAEQYLIYGSLNNKVTIYTSLGILFNQKKEYARALTYLLQASEWADKSGNYIDMADVQEFLIETYWGLGQTENAQNSLDKLLDLKDSITTIKLKTSVADMMVKYETNEKEKELLLNKQLLLEKDIKSQQTFLWFMVIFICLIISIFIIFMKFRAKQAQVKQAALELSLQEQKARNKVQEERLRISRELHDNIGSHLTLINALTEECDESNSRIKKVRNHIQLSMKELRKTVWLLNKESNSLEEIEIRLRDFLSNLEEHGKIIQIETKGNAKVILNDIQTTHLFRTIQEAVNNALKYADCSLISITLNNEIENQLEFLIEDNGKGFLQENMNSGNGVINMQYRMEQVKGHLQIESNPNNGTRIFGGFPLK